MGAKKLLNSLSIKLRSFDLYNMGLCVINLSAGPDNLPFKKATVSSGFNLLIEAQLLIWSKKKFKKEGSPSKLSTLMLIRGFE